MFFTILVFTLSPVIIHAAEDFTVKLTLNTPLLETNVQYDIELCCINESVYDICIHSKLFVTQLSIERTTSPFLSYINVIQTTNLITPVFTINGPPFSSYIVQSIDTESEIISFHFLTKSNHYSSVIITYSTIRSPSISPAITTDVPKSASYFSIPLNSKDKLESTAPISMEYSRLGVVTNTHKLSQNTFDMQIVKSTELLQSTSHLPYRAQYTYCYVPNINTLSFTSSVDG